MSSEDVGYFSATKICRLCLKSCENSISLFDENNQLAEKSVKEFLEELSGILLLPEDNLPETACQQCYKQLDDTRAFLIRIRKNDEFLHNIVQGDFIEETSEKSNDTATEDLVTVEEAEIQQEDVPTTGTTAINDLPEIVDSEEYAETVVEISDFPEYIDVSCLTDPATGVVVTETQESESPLLQATVEAPTLIQCKYCPQTFTRLRNCRQHEMRHFQDGFSCPYCDRKFVKKCDRVRHIKIHTNERSFACSICSKSFFTQAELNRHRKIHNSAKDFKCSQCETEFNEVTALKFHMRTVHNRERSHFCANCGKGFATASKVRRHQTSRICSQTKSLTTIHTGADDQFIILQEQIVSHPGDIDDDAVSEAAVVANLPLSYAKIGEDGSSLIEFIEEIKEW